MKKNYDEYKVFTEQASLNVKKKISSSKFGLRRQIFSNNNTPYVSDLLQNNLIKN